MAMARTLHDAIAEITAVLTQADVDNPRLDARVLIAHVLNIDTSQTFVHHDLVITPDQQAALAAAVQRRIAREPVSRIVGTREFWGLAFAVTPATLDPRGDTENLVSAVLDHCQRLNITAPRILDLGTGTGCIALALLQEMQNATAVGVDLSIDALRVAQANALRLAFAQRVSFARMSWSDALIGPFDVIVSNPPYLSAADMKNLSPEVRYDPASALDGGADGLECYRAIIADVKRIARSACILALEVGLGQAGQVVRMLEDRALRVAEVRSDLASIPRCVVAQI